MWQEQGKLSKQIDPELLILNIWAITQNYADFTQMEMVTGKTLRNRSMLQRVLQHTVHYDVVRYCSLSGRNQCYRSNCCHG